MKERMMMVFVFSYYMFFGFQIGFCADINNAVLFPVDGLLGDSYFPRDSGESDAPSPRNRFTVVWCGMYGDKSQYYNIRYKGTGAHSGMDIVGEVSENIYAIAKGKVIISECNTGGWGGLVVIEHAPSTFSISSLNNYYSVYAHLRKRNVIVGQLVHLGKFIGLMGGASSDECYGNSSGRHLHFQIDVGENFNYPKFIGYTANEYSDPHYNTIKTELGKESYDSILTDETVDPISFIEASYQYHPGKFSNGWRFCTSSNSTDFVPYSEPFAQFMANSAGILGMGFPITHVEQYPGTLDTQCSFHDNVNYKVWAQGFQNVSSQYNDPTGYLVLNPNIDNIPLGYKGVVFPVHGRLREYWELNYCNLGPPASNEFYREGTEIIVQWFEPTPNNYIAVGYWTATGIFQRSDEIKHTCFELRFKISDPNINMGCSPEGCDGQGGGEPLPDNVLSGDNWSIASYGLYGHVNHDTSEPSDKRTEYTNNDGRVASFFKFNNLQNSLRIDWYCRDPNNNIIETKNDTYCADGYSCDGVPAWEYCNLSNITNYGNWKVEVYFNERLVLTKPFTVEINLDKPINLNLILNITNNVNLTWNQVELAEKYRIYRNGNTIQETNNLYYTDTGVISNNSYTYKIIAIRGNRTSSFSDGVIVDIPADEILPPEIKEISIQ